MAAQMFTIFKSYLGRRAVDWKATPDAGSGEFMLILVNSAMEAGLSPTDEPLTLNDAQFYSAAAGDWFTQEADTWVALTDPWDWHG